MFSKFLTSNSSGIDRLRADRAKLFFPWNKKGGEKGQQAVFPPKLTPPCLWPTLSRLLLCRLLKVPLHRSIIKVRIISFRPKRGGSLHCAAPHFCTRILNETCVVVAPTGAPEGQQDRPTAAFETQSRMSGVSKNALHLTLWRFASRNSLRLVAWNEIQIPEMRTCVTFGCLWSFRKK